MIATSLRFIDLVVLSLLAGTMFGIWLGFNPARMTAGTYIEMQQHTIRSFNTVLPLMGMVCIVLTATLAVVTRDHPHSRYLLVAAIALLIAAGLITRLENQPINREIMRWSVNAPPASWMVLRDTWWQWHIARTVTTVAALSLTILAVLCG